MSVSPRRGTEPFLPRWVLNQILLWGEGVHPRGAGRALGNMDSRDKEACVGQWELWKDILRISLMPGQVYDSKIFRGQPAGFAKPAHRTTP